MLTKTEERETMSPMYKCKMNEKAGEWRLDEKVDLMRLCERVKE